MARVIFGAPGSPAMRLFFARIFPWVFILLGVGIGYAGIATLLRAHASTEWPVVEGRVMHAAVEHKRGNKGGTTYSAEVQYDYVVNGVTHSSNRVAFGSISSSDPSGARNVVNRYPKGKTVAVRHSPEDPSLSVLEPGVHGSAWFVPAFGGAFFLVGCCAAWFIPRSFNRSDSSRLSHTSEVVS